MALHLTGFGPLAGTLFSLIHGVRLGRERAILHTGFVQNSAVLHVFC